MAFIPDNLMPHKHIENRLFWIAVLIIFLFSAILTFSPVIRQHTWSVNLRWEQWLGFIIWIAGFWFLKKQAYQLRPDHNPYLIPITALLCGWGLMTIFRLETYYGFRQTIWLLLAFFLFSIGLRSANLLNFLQRYKYLWLVGGLVLTALTAFFGTYPGGVGPRQWLGCCGVYIQPTEFLKLLLVIYLAAYFSNRRPGNLPLVQLLMPTLVLIGAALLLLFFQHDLGTAFLFIFLYTIIIYFTSKRKVVLIFSSLFISVSAVAAYLLTRVVQERLDLWLWPWKDPEGRGYQIIQSIMAVAAGGVLGGGLGLGSPRVIPVAQSDFIFSAIAEETGIFGSLVLIILYGLLFASGMRSILRAPNNYQRFLAGGITSLITVQMILIIGGNLRIFPITGVTLPLVSYGGSSLLTSFAAILLLLLVGGSELESAPLTDPRPYRVISFFFLLGLAGIALANLWWGVIRREDLLSRQDNPRHYLADVYVKRGSIVDRNNVVISQSEGESGSFTRVLKYPPLSNTIGYAHPHYGLTGLESSMQVYLRGMQGVPMSEIWYHNIFYSQPPPGLDMRISIHMELQRIADDMLANRTGALVLLNAKTGEILVLASHPYYDANRIDENFQIWMGDERAPLLNRVSQGQYPVGTALGAFLLANVISQNSLPAFPEELNIKYDGVLMECTGKPDENMDWGKAISIGCPGALSVLGEFITPIRLLEIYRELGFDSNPSIPLPIPEERQLTGFSSTSLAFIGQETALVSPLQMAMAAAALSSDGIRPSPRLTLAVQTPHQGWIVLPSTQSSIALPSSTVSTTTRLLAVNNTPLWKVTGSAYNEDQLITWVVGGTRSSWEGTPLALALVLEDYDPESATNIAIDLMMKTLVP